MTRRADNAGNARRAGHASAGAAQVHLHVERIVVDAAAARAIDLPALRTAMREALAAHLAGAPPPVNHVTTADRFAAAAGNHLTPLLRARGSRC